MQRIFALSKKIIFQNIYQQFRNSIGIIINFLFLMNYPAAEQRGIAKE